MPSATVSARNLEAEDSEALCQSDMAKGNTVLWRLKGKKYTTTILNVYGKCMVSAQHTYDECEKCVIRPEHNKD